MRFDGIYPGTPNRYKCLSFLRLEHISTRTQGVPLCVISVLIKVITILIVKFVTSDLYERLKLTCLRHSYSVTKDLSR